MAFTGQEPIRVKTVKPPAKVQIPQEETDENEDEEEEEDTAGRCGGLWLLWLGSRYRTQLSLLFLAESSPPPPPPVVKKPLKQTKPNSAKDGAEPAEEEKPTPGRAPKVKSSTPQSPPPSRAPTVSSSNSTPQRPQPSREIRNIIRMYQSRPGPVPVPVQPSRWAWGFCGQRCFSPRGITLSVR